MIPVNTPHFGGNEKRYLAECIDSGWVSSEGPFVRRFEEGMSVLCGRRHAISVCNGSIALDLAFQVIGLVPGDEVILPSFTIISCAASIVRAGGIPVPCDVDPQHWNITPESIERSITPRTRVILVVHIYGLSCDMLKIEALASRHGLRIIEDAAEAHGQYSGDRPCGGFGDLSTFSFYANKHVSAGEGGMIVTDDDGIAQRCRHLRNLAFGKEIRFRHDELGWNYRLGNLQAAVALAQLECLSDTISRKRAIALHYSEAFKDLTSIQLPLHATSWCENHYWVYGVLLREGCGIDAATMMSQLAGLGVATRPFFWPIHRQPALAGMLPEVECPISESLAERGFYLPSGPGLEPDAQDKVIAAMRSVCNELP